MSAHRPRKRFGQHFLHDRGVIDRILDALAPRADDHVVEIGPGLGALTLPLLERAGRLDAVELDRDVIPLLEEKAASRGRLTVHQADALAFDFCALAGDGHPLRLVGNLPYNISTPLLFHLVTQRRCIRDMHFMLQKEVVDRMAASPGTRIYGRLSVMLAVFCRVEPLFNIGRGAFNPPPKVESAVARIIPDNDPRFPVDDIPLFGRMVTAAFSRRRKTLRNALRGFLDAEAIERVGIDPGLRPENLSPEDFARLANAAGA